MCIRDRLLEAGLDGIINKIDAPDPVETNIYSMSPEERKEAGIIAVSYTHLTKSIMRIRIVL